MFDLVFAKSSNLCLSPPPVTEAGLLAVDPLFYI